MLFNSIKVKFIVWIIATGARITHVNKTSFISANGNQQNIPESHFLVEVQMRQTLYIIHNVLLHTMSTIKLYTHTKHCRIKKMKIYQCSKTRKFEARKNEHCKEYICMLILTLQSFFNVYLNISVCCGQNILIPFQKST